MFIYKRARTCKRRCLIPLCVLMWKYMVVWRHRYCHTIWEIFGGVSFFLIIFLIHQTVSPDIQPPVKQASKQNDSVYALTKIYYTPHNNYTRRFMGEVGRNLIRTQIDADFQSNQQKKLWEFEHDTEGLPTMKWTDPESVVVKFQLNEPNNISKENLTYTISALGGNTHNGLGGVFNGIFRRFEPKEEVIPPFLAKLQWAIDKSFIEARSKNNISQVLQLKTNNQYISKKLSTLHNFMVLCTIIAPLPFFLINSSRLIIEKRSGQKEIMKLSNVTVNVLRLSHFLQSLLVAILYAIPVTVLLKATSIPLMPYSNGVILYLTLVFHFVNSASLAFVTTTLTQSLYHADSIGLLFYMATLLLDFMWYSEDVSEFILYAFCCFMPHTPIYMFWDEVLYFERSGVGTQFWNIQTKHNNKTCMSVLSVWGFLAIQLAVIMTIAWYLDLVRPGNYGVSRKWNFMCYRSYWRPSKKREVNFNVTAEKIVPRKRDKKFFEKGPRRAEVAITILDVSKVFKRWGKSEQKVALDSVEFDCFMGEITVLLGANGAGKTTLLNIVSGMFSATSGKVYIHGSDVAHRINVLRENISLCPQHNLNFPYLTVRENIKFFQMLQNKRTLNADSVNLTIDQLMKKLKLEHKADCYSHQLSYGMKRCLQVACSLAGGADVLVLDEPTSGMDADARHRLWDLIMTLREKKTILMTTSFLEEATALGDRIVILDKGKLRCHGTPMFLKQAMGVSFNLSITIKDSTQMKNLKELIGAVLPGVKYRIHDIRRITFSLPTKEHEKFPHMFDILEDKKSSLGITLMDVGMFMEELFLEFIEEEPIDERWAVQSGISYRHVEVNRISGLKLKKRQFVLLVIRLFNYYWRKKYQFLLLHFLTPVLGFILVSLSTNDSLRFNKVFNQHKHGYTEISAILFNVGPYRRSAMLDIAEKYPDLTIVYSNDVDRDITNSSQNYMNKKIGLNISKKYAKIYHDLDPYAMSKSINILSNLYMKIHMPDKNSRIEGTYTPVQLTAANQTKSEPKNVFDCLEWTVWVVFVSVIPLASFINICIEEYRTGARDNHMMAGCTPLQHWGAKLTAHLAAYWAIIPVPLLFCTLMLDFDKTFNEIYFLGSLLVLLCAYGPAFLTHLYLLSFVLHQNEAMCHIYILSIIFGIILPVVTSVLELLWRTHFLLGTINIILVSISRFSPLFVMALGVGRLTLQARANAFCRINKNLCPGLVSDSDFFSAQTCCESASKTPYGYLQSKHSGLYDLLNLILLFVFNSIIVLLLENRILQYALERLIHLRYKRPAHTFHDNNVMKEKVYVDQAMRYHEYRDDMLLVDDVYKHFSNFFNTMHGYQVVKGVSFAARLGECVALLGPQGSGKSSLLEILAGQRVMTRGNAMVDGNFIRKHRSKYIHRISLTSDGGMDTFMTGHQNLVFIAKLQGYCDEMATKLSLLALRFMGLAPDQTKVIRYSSGCRKRLSLCNTLVLAPAVALLDEPMVHTDANTKPLVAKAITRLMLEPAVVVVTESSVDWRQMQTVFTRIALISSGQLATIGQADEVIAGLAKGYTARIKLKVVTAYREDRSRKISSYNVDETSSSSSEEEVEDPTMHTEKSVVYAHGVTDFKREFKKMFETSTVTGEHLCMLYFDIKDDKLLYSELFQKLEELKKKFDDVVEDYSISSTTVEDVFLRISHEVHQEMKILHPHPHRKKLMVPNK